MAKKTNLSFTRDDEGLRWRVSFDIPSVKRVFQAEGVVSTTEGFTPEREYRAAITAIRKQFQEWEQILKYL